MNRGSFNINKAISSLVAWVSRCFRKITICGRNLAATALDVVETAQSMAHLEQITTVGRLGCDGRLPGALERTQRVARPHTSQTRPPETEPRDGQQLGRSYKTFFVI